MGRTVCVFCYYNGGKVQGMLCVYSATIVGGMVWGVLCVYSATIMGERCRACCVCILLQ